MKVALIFRKPRSGGQSIEMLFRTIATELRRLVDVVEYQAGPRMLVHRDAHRLRRLDADVYHITGDVNYLTLLLPWSRTVLTVHDIGRYLYGLPHPKRWLYRLLWLELPMRAAGVVTVVSAKTRDDIAEHLGFDAEGLEVVPNCYSPLFRFHRATLRRDCLTILQVGTAPHKNVLRLCEALRGLPCRLVLVGPVGEDLRAKLLDCQIRWESYVGLPTDALVQKYVESDLVTFISLHEGFGVPIIEAQAVGRPLVTSNVSPLKEVAGEGACLVDPHDVVSIRSGLIRIIEDQPYREELICRGLDNAAQYSPEQVARSYLALYERLANVGS